MLFGWYSRNTGNESSGKSGWLLLRIGLVVLLYGILLAGYDFIWRFLYEDLYTLAIEIQELAAFGSIGNWALSLVLASLMLSVVIGTFGNINHVSMHRFYRDRLMEAYLVSPNGESCDQHAASNYFYLRDIVQTTALTL